MGFHMERSVSSAPEACKAATTRAAAAAAAAVGLLPHLRRMIRDDFHTERSVYTSVLTSREESPLPPAPDDASATGRTYDDITKSPPPHLRCVVSPLSSLPPALWMHRRVTTSFFINRRRPGVEAASSRAFRKADTRLFGA